MREIRLSYQDGLNARYGFFHDIISEDGRHDCYVIRRDDAYWMFEFNAATLRPGDEIPAIEVEPYEVLETRWRVKP